MFRTWPGVRPKTRPLLSVGTMFARPWRVTPWSSLLGPSRLSRAAEMASVSLARPRSYSRVRTVAAW